MIILKSNCIFDARSEGCFAGYVAIKDQRIEKVDRGEPPKEYRRLADAWFDCGDQTVLPGFCDNHVHLYPGALALRSPNIRETKCEEEAAEKLFDFYRDRPDGWALGFGWLHYKWEGKRLPRKESLDRFFPDRPAAVFNDEMHSLWVNSRALELCGITRQSGGSESGVQRDEDGTPSGFLLEPEAMRPVTEKLFSALSREEEKQAVGAFIKKAHALGVTAVADNDLIDSCNYPLYGEMEQEKRLAIRVFFSPSMFTPLEELLALRERYQTDRLAFLGVKGFLDGTPLGHTGLLLSEYADRPGFNGKCLQDMEWLKENARTFSRHRIPMRLHACGDGAVRLALDLIEETKETTGVTETRNTIEHIECIDPADLPRFAKTKTIASIQPRHMVMNSLAEHEIFGILGAERSRWAWPGKSLQRSGARVSFGTDYPIVELDPLNTIYRAVARVMADDLPAEGWNPQERFTIAEALKNATANTAYLMQREERFGTLEAGKLADVAVLSENIFAAPLRRIPEIYVEKTIFDGKLVYEKKGR